MKLKCVMARVMGENMKDECKEKVRSDQHSEAEDGLDNSMVVDEGEQDFTNPTDHQKFGLEDDQASLKLKDCNDKTDAEALQLLMIGFRRDSVQDMRPQPCASLEILSASLEILRASVCMFSASLEILRFRELLIYACKGDKEKLVGLLQECEDEKMKVNEEDSWICGQIGQKEQNDYTGVNGLAQSSESKHSLAIRESWFLKS
ncbi:hypothetical protein Tco_1106741 [Tanacetum coccineum]